jgi:hypothetical protein
MGPVWLEPIPGHNFGLGRVGRASKKPDMKISCPGLAWSDVGPLFSAQTWPVGLKNSWAVRPSGWAFRKTCKSLAQAWPESTVGPIFAAQARPDNMFWPDRPGHFQVGPTGPGFPCSGILEPSLVDYDPYQIYLPLTCEIFHLADKNRVLK